MKGVIFIINRDFNDGDNFTGNDVDLIVANINANETSINGLTTNKVDKVSGKSLVADTTITDLTDTTDTSLHYHSSDRNRSNHTGTQLASTITQDSSNRFVSDTEKSTWNGNNAEIVDARGEDINLKTRLDKVDSSLADSPHMRVNHYYVGITQKYNTITSAYNQWVADGKLKSVIHVMSGEYNETLLAFDVGGKLSIIGENRNTVIWRTKTGYYKDSPLCFQNGYLSNITFIADITDNASFVYTDLASGNPFIDSIGSAYALHVDFDNGEVESNTIIENCDMVSYINAGLGCGTRKNQSIELINCNIYSYTPANFNTQATQNGGLLFHSFSGSNITNQNLKMKNVNIFSEKGKAFQFLDQSIDNTSKLTVEFINVNLLNNNTSELVNFSSNLLSLEKSKNSFGNNAPLLNSNNSQLYPITNNAGNTVQVTDFNTVITTKFFHGEVGCLNLPVAGRAWFGECISYNSTYSVQYAWDLTGSYTKYKRHCSNGIYSIWLPCTEETDYIIQSVFNVFSLGYDGYAKATITDANLALKCGYYLCTTNTPSGSASIIQAITCNQYYGVQYGWVLTTGAKYKRTLLNGILSTWIAISEA